MRHLDAARRFVVKIGSALLVDDETGTIRRAWLESLALNIADARKAGQDVIIVSSGAIALGRRLLGLPTGKLKLEEKQAAAAAESLQEQSDVLARAVAVFKLKTAAQARPQSQPQHPAHKQSAAPVMNSPAAARMVNPPPAVAAARKPAVASLPPERAASSGLKANLKLRSGVTKGR